MLDEAGPERRCCADMQGTLLRAGRVAASIVAVVALTTFPDDTAVLLRRFASVISGADLILWIIVGAICASVLRDVYKFWKEWRERQNPALPEGKEWEVLSYWGEDYGAGRVLVALSSKRFPHTIRNTRTGEIREISFPGGGEPPRPTPLSLDDF